MAIAKKPTQIVKKKSESEVNQVINRGGSVAEKKRTAEDQKVLLRIPSEMLDRVDKDVKKQRIKTPRNTWILEAILEKLEGEKT